jgi:hypothetical protein
VEVTGVTMENAGGMLDWAVTGDELRIGWNTQVPINLVPLDQLLVINLKTTGEFTGGKAIRFTVGANPLNELADGYFETIPGAVLGTDVIEASTTGIGDQPVSEKIQLGNHPNPFFNLTTLTYSLPFEGRVTLEITSMLGNRVATLVNAKQTAGDYSVDYFTETLAPGVYTATLKLEGKSSDLIRTIKIIRAW